MNPFDLRGPEFLLVYATYGGLVLLGMVLMRRRRESGPVPRLDLSDPYLVAYLRVGRDEAVRAALVSLVDRKLVIPGDPSWRTADAAAVMHPLERALVTRFSGDGDKPDAERWDPAVERACRELGGVLQRLGLMPDEGVARARMRRVRFAMLFLAVPAAIKVAVALERGRQNVAILVVLAVAFAWGAYLLRGGRLTERGKRVLTDLRTLFAGLRQRAARIAPGGNTGEVALVAGLFGMAALPLAAFPYAEALGGRRPEPDGAGGSGCSASVSSCGSTCSSDSGDGGGGCGGGCGGCGGS